MGTLGLTLRGDHAIAFEVRDAKGRIVESGPLSNDRDIESKPCKIGGFVAFFEGELPSDGTKVLHVFRPATEDEPGDLKLLCALPDTQSTAGLLASSFPAAAGFADFAERLSSSRWRRWLFEVDEAISNDDKALAERAGRLKADELDMAAKSAGLDSCWGPSAIRRFLDVRGSRF